MLILSYPGGCLHHIFNNIFEKNIPMGSLCQIIVMCILKSQIRCFRSLVLSPCCSSPSGMGSYLCSYLISQSYDPGKKCNP